jgi:hypothetical protein
MSSALSLSQLGTSLFGSSSQSSASTQLAQALSGSSSSTWMDPSTSSTSSSSQYLSLDSALGSAITSALSSHIQGEGTLAGEAALNRIEAQIAKKQSAANASQSPTSSSPNGYGTVQNLMSTLDNITLDNGALPTIPSSTAAGGYSAVQNMMDSLDNITITQPASALGVPSGASVLQNVDSILATPPPVNVTA